MISAAVGKELRPLAHTAPERARHSSRLAQFTRRSDRIKNAKISLDGPHGRGRRSRRRGWLPEIAGEAGDDIRFKFSGYADGDARTVADRSLRVDVAERSGARAS